jgi:hypothetical protein
VPLPVLDERGFVAELLSAGVALEALLSRVGGLVGLEIEQKVDGFRI